MKELTSLRVKRLCVNAVILACAMIISYIESVAAPLIPIPIPGFKPGFANIAVLFALYAAGTADALVISLARVALTSLLFGSPSSFIFSLSGALLSFAVLLISKYIIKDRLSLFGISVLSAAAHNFGQTAAACFVMGTGAVFSYLPYLLIVSVPLGLLTGFLASQILKREDLRRFLP